MNITDQNYKDVIENNNTLIYLGAPWCPGCKVLKPIVEELAGQNSGETVIGLTNVDENAAISVEFGIRQIPAVLFFKDGKLVEKLVGNSTTKAILESKLKEHFN